jgi:hypothetical protein
VNRRISNIRPIFRYFGVQYAFEIAVSLVANIQDSSVCNLPVCIQVSVMMHFLKGVSHFESRSKVGSSCTISTKAFR